MRICNQCSVQNCTGHVPVLPLYISPSIILASSPTLRYCTVSYKIVLQICLVRRYFVLMHKFLVASSPVSPIFSMHARKEGGPGILSHVTNVDKMALCNAPRKASISSWHLWSIKRGSPRLIRIVLPSLTLSAAFLLTHIEPEGSKIVLGRAQFS